MSRETLNSKKYRDFAWKIAGKAQVRRTQPISSNQPVTGSFYWAFAYLAYSIMGSEPRGFSRYLRTRVLQFLDSFVPPYVI